jgi:long-chain acyl-CoA synthetase
MNEPLKFLFELPERAHRLHPKSDLLAEKIDGKLKKVSTLAFTELTDEIAYGLLQLGIDANDRVAVISSNRIAWQVIDLGIAKICANNVPIYPNITEKDYEYILNDAGVKIVFVETEDLFQKISNIKDQIPSLEAIYTINKVEHANNWKEVLALGRENPNPKKLKENQSKANPDELYTFVYTSGTTGDPKGVMLSHNNIISQLIAVEKVIHFDNTDRAISFLPLCHIFERTIEYMYFYKGTSIYYAENMDTIGDNLKEYQPTIMPTVPRLLEKVYDKIMAKGYALSGIKKKLFFWAIDLGLDFELEGKSWWYTKQLKIANKLIFSKWREALGGNIRFVISGAAALQPRLARIFTAGGINILEGYGLSETSPVIACNNFESDGVCFGTVGKVIDKVEVKIAEDGEILCKGPNVMLGYYNKPEKTAEVMDANGWFHTGDIGELIKGKYLKITDRKKEIFKTSGGKYIAPQPMENKFKESVYVEQVMVIGEGQKHASALITPSVDALQVWAAKNNIAFTSLKELCENVKTKTLYQREVAKYNQDFSHYEHVKRFELLPYTWSIEGGEMTPTLKLKRKQIMAKYEMQINRIYNID